LNKYLNRVVMFQHQTSLRYYLPEGRWYNYHTVAISYKQSFAISTVWRSSYASHDGEAH